MECQDKNCQEKSMLQLSWPGKEDLKMCIEHGMDLFRLAQHMSWAE